MECVAGRASPVRLPLVFGVHLPRRLLHLAVIVAPPPLTVELQPAEIQAIVSDQQVMCGARLGGESVPISAPYWSEHTRL